MVAGERTGRVADVLEVAAARLVAPFRLRGVVDVSVVRRDVVRSRVADSLVDKSSRAVVLPIFFRERGFVACIEDGCFSTSVLVVPECSSPISAFADFVLTDRFLFDIRVFEFPGGAFFSTDISVVSLDTTLLSCCAAPSPVERLRFVLRFTAGWVDASAAILRVARLRTPRADTAFSVAPVAVASVFVVSESVGFCFVTVRFAVLLLVTRRLGVGFSSVADGLLDPSAETCSAASVIRFILNSRDYATKCGERC